ncbi:MAG: DUF1858 domain-containing protein [Clostridia bacterium]|nr:DUF1858 domain-containing protein [Clostridia bacterium]
MEEIIKKDMTIKEIIDMDEELAEIFFAFGMFCIGCAMASGETLEEACEVHGIECEEILKALNLAINQQ